MNYRFKVSALIAGSLGAFLANVMLLTALVFIALQLQILARFIDVVGAVIEGYKLSQHSDSVSTWAMIRGGGILIAQTAALGVIGNLLGWYSYIYLTARGKTQAGYASFLAPIVVGFFIGSSLILLCCFVFSFLIGAVFRSMTEDELLSAALRFLKREYPSADHDTDTRTLHALVERVIPGGNQNFDPTVLRIQESLLDTYGFWLEPDFILPAIKEHLPEENQTAA